MSSASCRWRCAAHARVTSAILALLAPACVRAQDTPLRTVRLAVQHDPPLIFSDAQGRPSGLVPDLLAAIARREGWRIEYVPGNWQTCLERLEKGEVDLVGAIGWSEERARKFDISHETILVNWGRLYAHPGSVPQSFLDLEGRVVAVQRGDIHGQALKDLLDRFGVVADFVRLDTYTEVLDRVRLGTVDAGVVTRLFTYGGKSLPAGLVETPIIFSPVQLRFAVPKGRNADLLTAIDNRLRDAARGSGGFYRAALARWLPAAPTSAKLPRWVPWVEWIATAVVFVLGAAFLNILGFRRQLRKRTAELTAANAALRRSEERYRLLLERAPLPIAVHVDDKVVFANAAAARAIGVDSPECLDGLSIWDVVHPDSHEVSRERIRRVCAGESDLPPVQEKFIRRDGREIDVEVAVAPVEYQGRPGALVVWTDITARLRAEARMRHVAEQMPVMLDAFDEHGRFVLWNQECERVTGYRAAEIVGNPNAFELLFPDAEIRDQVLRRVRKDEGDYRNVEVEITCKDGSRRVIAWSNISDAHPIPGWSCWAVGVDVTERQKAREALAEANRMLRLILDTIPARVFWKDRNSVYLGCNRSFAQDIGLNDPREVPGKTDAQIVTTEDADSYLRDDQWVMEHRAPKLRYVERYTDPGGRIRILRTSKVPLVDADGQVIGVLGTYEDITREKELEIGHRRLTAGIHQAAEAVVIANAAGDIEYVNPAFEKITGYPRAEVVGRNPRILKSDRHSPEFYKALWETITAGKVWRGRFVNRRKDGSLYSEDAAISPVTDDAGAIVNFVKIARDVTHELELETQLEQARRLEAIGRLAGGIAHDFNNILQAQIGFLEFIADEAPANGRLQEDLEEARKCAGKAADLTRQLLAFSRRQVLKPEHLDLNEVLSDSLSMLRRLIPENIGIEFIPAKRLGTVYADRVQIAQVVMNLCANARDAMPDGGSMTIETENVRIDPEYCRSHSWAKPGRYVLFSVTDTGTGMSSETLEHVFEPFYTTKEVGKGTGLGLATVYGIVRQHEGMINVYSESGKGTLFKVYLPESERRAVEVGRELPGPTVGGKETILVVEDDDGVRRTAERILERAGYTVYTARDGAEALGLFADHSQDIALALLDVVMPGLGGREVYERFRAINPRLRVLFSSGYSENAIHTRFILDRGLQLLRKPYDRKTLLRYVREVLDGPAPQRPEGDRTSAHSKQKRQKGTGSGKNGRRV
ncbi:MAG: PAS domain S-box protein [Kiritimatiellaeota bacterium]|nr:PAS domain S-box protein [Kiritimatiellota bacterium]